MHVDLGDDRVNILAGKGTDGLFDVPLDDLAVEKQRCVGESLAVKGRVKRPETQFGFTDDAGARIGILVEKGIELRHIDN